MVAKKKPIEILPTEIVLVTDSPELAFVKNEYNHVTKYTSVIYDTRDRFFANYMTVAIALFGFLGFLQSQEAGSTSGGEIRQKLLGLASFMLIALVIFGLGTLFLLLGNWVARDFYRQRKRRLQEMILFGGSEAEFREKLEEFLKFSRDKTKWKYRLTSIYMIYLSSIAAANSLAILIGLTFASHVSSGRNSVAIFLSVFLAQQLVCYLYIRMYTRKEYPEG